MLGWMLKRGEHAQDADAGDTSRLDQPDTPAPVFAARAFKSALFGMPAVPGDETRNIRQSKASRKAARGPERGSGTPSRPPGILLTQGTATSRRKRVSFGNDVTEATKPYGGGQTAVVGDKAGERNARRAEAALTARTDNSAASRESGPASDSEGDWEDDEGDCTLDVTIDLNEPHSQSGRYWKEEFEKYHQEARAEMEKLLKYKKLAKSYARQKDAEAIQLIECLRDEQQKVIDMERKKAENASQIASKHRPPSDDDSSEQLSKLTKQAAFAAQYRHRVQELEQELDQHVRPRGGDAEGRGRLRRHAAASPTTQKTLVETKRELRRARTQLKELDALREQVSTLRARLKAAEAHASRYERDDLASSGEAQIRSLKAQLGKSREESKKKTEELQQLKSDLKCNEASLADTNSVLQRAQAKITDLKRKMRNMKATRPDQARASSWRSRADASQESESASRRAKGAGQDDEGQGAHDSGAAATQREMGPGQCRDDAEAAPNALRERTNLGRPRWQPFVPRSPRNRAHLGEDASRRPGAVPAATHPEVIAAPALPAMGDASEVDLLRGGFSRVYGPEANRRAGRGLHHDKHIGTAVLGKVSRSRGLPPERRAAAVTRIQRSMAEKERAPRRRGHDKENVRP